MSDDPTRMRNQPTINQGGSMSWLLPSGGLALIASIVFILAIPIAPALAWIGLIIQIALFVAMCVSAAVIPEGRRRGTIFAILMLTIAISALVVTYLIYALQTTTAS